VFLEDGLEWMFPWLLAARVELLDGIILSCVQFSLDNFRPDTHYVTCRNPQSTLSQLRTCQGCEQMRMSTTPNNSLHPGLLCKPSCSTGHKTPLYLEVIFIQACLVKRLRVSLCSDIVIHL
jgi:hypothetical protein